LFIEVTFKVPVFSRVAVLFVSTAVKDPSFVKVPELVTVLILVKVPAVSFVKVPALVTVLLAVKVPVLSKVEVSLFSKSTAVKDPSFVKVS
jgi:hypothetical protein